MSSILICSVQTTDARFDFIPYTRLKFYFNMQNCSLGSHKMQSVFIR